MHSRRPEESKTVLDPLILLAWFVHFGRFDCPIKIAPGYSVPLITP